MMCTCKQMIRFVDYATLVKLTMPLMWVPVHTNLITSAFVLKQQNYKITW